MEVTKRGDEGATWVGSQRLRINGSIPDANTADMINGLLVEEPWRCCLGQPVMVTGQRQMFEGPLGAW